MLRLAGASVVSGAVLGLLVLTSFGEATRVGPTLAIAAGALGAAACALIIARSLLNY
jgi:hypothetical protein